MSKVINLNAYRNKSMAKIKVEDVRLTKEDRMDAKDTLVCDDDKYILEMFYGDSEDLKEM